MTGSKIHLANLFQKPFSNRLISYMTSLLEVEKNDFYFQFFNLCKEGCIILFLTLFF